MISRYVRGAAVSIRENDVDSMPGGPFEFLAFSRDDGSRQTDLSCTLPRLCTLQSAELDSLRRFCGRSPSLADTCGGRFPLLCRDRRAGWLAAGKEWPLLRSPIALETHHPVPPPA